LIRYYFFQSHGILYTSKRLVIVSVNCLFHDGETTTEVHYSTCSLLFLGLHTIPSPPSSAVVKKE